MTKLTVERVFSSPPLNGSPPVDLRFAPDNTYVTYRAASTDDRERYELHKIDLQNGQRSVLVDPRDIGATSSDVTSLTAEERADRERRRDFSHGITQYHWRPKHPHQLLLPINGQAYLVDVENSQIPPQPLCPSETRQSGFQFSPNGEQLAYVRERDLYVLNISEGTETRLTHVQNELECYGLADFLAAEEMHRFEGFWWHADNTGLFYTRVDDTQVKISHRLELDADGSRSVSQRYPFAGAVNPSVELHYQKVGGNTGTRLWRSEEADEYLARVMPLEDGILVQIQDRRQQQLRYLTQTGDALSANGWQETFRETSSTWVNLTNDTHACDHGLVTTEESSGHRQAVLIDPDGNIRSLAGPNHINNVLACTADAIFVTGWDDTPLENHLYKLNYRDAPSEQITAGSGWHEITLNSLGTGFIDRFSNHETMLEISHTDLVTDARTELHRETVTTEHPYGPYISKHAIASYGHITAEDGHPLYYRLTPPAEITSTHPVIVYVYGGPGAQKVRNDWGTALVQLFAHQGFGVLELDNRGTANRGREFEAPLYKSMGSVEVTDQVAGLGVLDDIEWADTDRVGVYGHSYGGYMTLMCLAQAPTRFAAGVAVAPVCDWRLYDSHYTERFMGLPEENESGYAHGDVLNHLDNLNAPLLLMHGMADDNVLFQNTTKIMDRLQELGKPFELMTYPGAKHSMQERHVSIHRFKMILDFFSRNL